MKIYLRTAKETSAVYILELGVDKASIKRDQWDDLVGSFSGPGRELGPSTLHENVIHILRQEVSELKKAAAMAAAEHERELAALRSQLRRETAAHNALYGGGLPPPTIPSVLPGLLPPSTKNE